MRGLGEMFAGMDFARRGIGIDLDYLGLGPRESAYRIALEIPGARLRAYHDASESGPPLLIIPAPFKRPYIWDLLPEVSVVRRFLSRGFRVYLTDWTTPDGGEDDFGLADYACRIPLAATKAIRDETGVDAPILAGNSIGGTLAAIFAALFPQRASGLALIDAPLAFGEHGGPLGAAVAMVPHARMIRAMFGSPVPGSAIDVLCAAAAPEVFELQRRYDLFSCLFDARALAIHMRMERWSCDEFPLPGRLFEDVVERLYRNDCFLEGTLRVGDRLARLADLQGPVVAVVNDAGIIVPPGSVTEGLRKARRASVELVEYSRDAGPMLQHLGPLVAPAAHRHLWPVILEWATAPGALRADGRSSRFVRGASVS